MSTVATVTTVRRAVLWVPDWPVVSAMTSAGLKAAAPAAVLGGRSLEAVSATARSTGVRRGMRKRQAQRTCPEITLLPADDGRDSREFEAVAAAAEHVVAGVEISRPGLLMIPADGAARFHGSEEALAEALVTAIADHTGYECAVGTADGLLAAIMAARAATLVPPGSSADFLAPMGINALTLAAMERRQRQSVEELVGVLIRLGLHTLGDFTALQVGDVLTRFGRVGMWAHRLARGEDVRPPVLRRSDEDITVEYAFEEPAQRLEQLAPVAQLVADQLDQALLVAGVRCGRVRITAHTESGQVERVWRTDVGVRPGAFARHMRERVRWQLEGWLSGTAQGPEPAPLLSLEVTAEDVVALGAEQDYLWGGTSGADSRAQRTLERVQSLVGPEGVLAVQEQGGRSPRDRVLTLPWGQERPPARAAAHPWPGRLPDPPPATVLAVPEPLAVLDAGGRAVVVDRRLGVSAPPTWVRHLNASPRHRVGGDAPRLGEPVPIDSWAGPWPMVERWWSDNASRRVHLQIVLADGPALLVAYSDGQWVLEALYD